MTALALEGLVLMNEGSVAEGMWRLDGTAAAVVGGICATLRRARRRSVRDDDARGASAQRRPGRLGTWAPVRLMTPSAKSAAIRAHEQPRNCAGPSRMPLTGCRATSREGVAMGFGTSAAKHACTASADKARRAPAHPPIRPASWPRRRPFGLRVQASSVRPPHRSRPSRSVGK